MGISRIHPFYKQIVRVIVVKNEAAKNSAVRQEVQLWVFGMRTILNYSCWHPGSLTGMTTMMMTMTMIDHGDYDHDDHGDYDDD